MCGPWIDLQTVVGLFERRDTMRERKEEQGNSWRELKKMLKLARNTLRKSHTLTVPYNHAPVTNFERGVPTTLVRDLSVEEKKWQVWTVSQTQFDMKPAPWFVAAVPKDETWVVERFGKPRELAPGFHFFIPKVDKVKSVKSLTPLTTGVVTRNLGVNQELDVYLVAHFQVVDASKSAYYSHPAVKDGDSERVLMTLAQNAVKDFAASKSEINAQDGVALKELVLKELSANAEELGLKMIDVEFRGAFSNKERVPDKLRAMTAPDKDPSVPGHGLANDYWADELTPPFFEKKKYGSEYEPVTPATVSLEWSIPSPPDFHHFNMIPKMIAPQSEGKVEKSSH
jgi:hypothetical protein